MTQFGLFDAPLSLLESERGSVTYHAGFLPIANAEACFAVLREGIDWHAQRRVMYEREVDVPLDERNDGRTGVRGLPSPEPALAEKLLADRDQHLGEHGVLAREVPVEPRAADAHRGTYLVDAHAVEAALGEEPRGLLEDLIATAERRFRRVHGVESRQSG